MSNQKTYVPGVWAKERTSPFTVLTLNCKADELIKFIQANADNGWIRFGVTAKKNPDDKSTHSVYLDTWKPGGSRPLEGARQAVRNAPPASRHVPDTSGEEPPF